MPNPFPAANYMSNANRSSKDLRQSFEDITYNFKRMPAGAAPQDLAGAQSVLFPTGAHPCISILSSASRLITKIDPSNYNDGATLFLRMSAPTNVVHDIGGNGSIHLNNIYKPNPANGNIGRTFYGGSNGLGGLSSENYFGPDFLLLILDNNEWYEVTSSPRRIFRYTLALPTINQTVASGQPVMWAGAGSGPYIAYTDVPLGGPAFSLGIQPPNLPTTGTYAQNGAGGLMAPYTKPKSTEYSLAFCKPNRVRFSWCVTLDGSDTSGTYRELVVLVSNASQPNLDSLSNSDHLRGVRSITRIPANMAVKTFTGKTPWFEPKDSAITTVQFEEFYRLILNHDSTNSGGAKVHVANVSDYLDHLTLEAEY